MPPYDERLPERLWSGISSLETWRQRGLWDDAALTWAYERERYLQQNHGVAVSSAAASYPEFVRRRFSWLTEVPPSANIIKSAVDTLVARLFTSLPSVEVLTENAQHEERFAAQDRTDALNSTLNTPTADRVMRAGGRDGLLKGMGIMRPVVSRGQVRYERIHKYQLAWDPYDARDGDPMVLHYWQRVPRSRLWGHVAQRKGVKGTAAALKKLSEMGSIGESGPYQECYYTPYDWELQAANARPNDDALLVLHTWRLPGAAGDDVPEACRGRYIITVHGSGGFDRAYGSRWELGAFVLHDGPWTRQTFPIVWWSPFPADEGIGGQGLGHALTPWQCAVDRTVWKIQRTLDKLSHAKVVVREGTIRNKESLLALGIAIVEVAAEALGDRGWEIINGTVLNPDELRWLDWMLTASRSENGINQMLSQGGSQLGANAAAVALVEEDHRQLDRLADVDTAFGEFRLALGRETLNAIDDALAQDRQFSAQWRDNDGRMRRRPWAKLIPTNGEYHLDLEQVGILGKSRAGRITKILDMGQRGLIDPQLAKDALLSSPDVRRMAAEATAGMRLVQEQLNELERPDGDHDSITPDKNVPLDYAKQLVQARIQMATAPGSRAKPETVSRLMAYKQTIEDLIAEGGATPQGAPAGAPVSGMPPGAGPMPPMPGGLPMPGGMTGIPGPM